MAYVGECGNEPSGSINAWDFLTSSTPVIFSKMTLLHGVIQSVSQLTFLDITSKLYAVAIFVNSPTHSIYYVKYMHLYFPRFLTYHHERQSYRKHPQCYHILKLTHKKHYSPEWLSFSSISYRPQFQDYAQQLLVLSIFLTTLSAK
jgi:hypothetical protein